MIEDQGNGTEPPPVQTLDEAKFRGMLQNWAWARSSVFARGKGFLSQKKSSSSSEPDFEGTFDLRHTLDIRY